MRATCPEEPATDGPAGVLAASPPDASPPDAVPADRQGGAPCEVFVPGATSLAALERTYRTRAAVRLHPDCRAGIRRSADRVRRQADGERPIYGVNTGFGKLAGIRIPAGEVRNLQRNLVLSHCVGLGDRLPDEHAHLVIALKLLSLGRGASGVRPAVIDCLEAMLARDVVPVIPVQGSVGASGDLAPLAHLAAVAIGEGEAIRGSRRASGSEALRAAEIEPLALGPKEGLALLNGTQFSTACALAALFDAWRAAESSLVTGALSTDAVMGSDEPLEAGIHALRGHRGACEAARTARELLAGSEIRESHRERDDRVQDPYCIRCQPQVTGAAIDLLRQAGETLRIEANGATDNPLVLPESGRIVSGGNFHGQPVAFAADQIALAAAEIGSVVQRRIAVLVDPSLSAGLSPFLSPDPGTHSGLMAAEIASAALASENRHLAAPCSTDSIPTGAAQEDHVSMSAHGAWRLKRMVENLQRLVAIEWIAASEGIEQRAPLRTSRPLRCAVDLLRSAVPRLAADRPLSGDIAAAAALVEAGDVVEACGVCRLPSLGAVE